MKFVSVFDSVVNALSTAKVGALATELFAKNGISIDSNAIAMDLVEYFIEQGYLARANAIAYFALGGNTELQVIAPVINRLYKERR